MYTNKLAGIFLFLIFIISCSSSDTAVYLRMGGKHLHLNDGTHELFWFDGIHSNDPENIMFADIEKEFMRYKPDLVMVEGGRDKNIKNTKSEAVLYGESSFTAFLAQQHNIECISTEPLDSYIGENLLINYKMNDIIAMITLRQIKQWQRETKSRVINLSEIIVDFVRSSSNNMFTAIDIEIDLEYIQNLLEPFTGFKISNENWLSIPAHKIVYDDINIINTIWKDTINIRNKYLVELIREKKKAYTKIYIMMGFDHAIEMKEQLEVLYKGNL